MRLGKRKLKSLEPFDYVVIVVLSIYAVIVFYPFYNAILSSFVSLKEYSSNPAMLLPKSFIADNYEYILKKTSIVRAYANTLFLCVVGTAISMFITTCMAYAFSRKKFPGKKALYGMALLTMIFNGGVIPIYLNIKSLGLMNSLWAIILMYSVNTYYMVLMKNSFEALPEAVHEAAVIDGANELTIFFKIMLPMALPTVVTFSLFTFVNYWNEWYFSTLIIKDRSMMPLQCILRGIISESSSSSMMLASVLKLDVFSNGIKMASVVATMLPIMLIYPFVQKYFIKGITAGAVKT